MRVTAVVQALALVGAVASGCLAPSPDVCVCPIVAALDAPAGSADCAGLL